MKARSHKKASNLDMRFLFCFGLMLLGSTYAQDKFVSIGNEVFRISPDNQISAVILDAQKAEVGTQFGSTLPEVSPDNQWIAFSRGYDTWLYDAVTGVSKQITHFARPY